MFFMPHDFVRRHAAAAFFNCRVIAASYRLFIFIFTIAASLHIRLLSPVSSRAAVLPPASFRRSHIFIRRIVLCRLHGRHVCLFSLDYADITVHTPKPAARDISSATRAISPTLITPRVMRATAKLKTA